MPVWKGKDAGGHDVVRYFAPEQEAHARALGFIPASSAEAAQETGTIDDTTGGALGAVGAATSAGLSGATLGLSDLGLRAVLSDAEMGRVAGDRAAHPVLSGAAQLAGAVGPAFLSGGALAPSSLASRAGAAVSERAGGGLLGHTIGGAAEGALYGAGQGISDVSLSSDPLTVERAASAISSNMLLGGAIGAGAGLIGGVADAGLRRAKHAIDDALARRAIEDTSPDLAALADRGDTKGLKTARDVEIERIDAERVPLRKQFVEDLQDFRERGIEVNLGDATKDLMHVGEAREANAAFKRASVEMRQALDNKVALAERPQKVLGALQTQEQAMVRIEELGRAAMADHEASLPLVRDKIKAEVLAGKVDLAPVPSALTPRGVDEAIDREMLRRFGNMNGPELPKSLRIIDEMYPGAIERNRKLQRHIAGLIEEPASERLTQIDAARDALGQPKPKSLGAQLIGAIAPYAGPAGAIAAAGQHAVGGLRKAIGAAATKTGAAVSSFLDTAAKVGSRAAPAAIPAATAVLAGMRFGRGPEPKSQELPDLYAARTAELREQTMMMPDGSIQMRPAARMAITRQLAPLAAVDPLLADKVETVKARTIAYMSSKIPKRPEIGGIQVGPDTWRPSDLQMRSWARTVRACEDPHGVELRLAAGVVTPEEAEAYRACYPERLAALRSTIFAATPTLAKTLPTKKKVALYVMTGVPTMPALQPNIFKVLQASFAVEPGTAGGSQAPKPMPAFGALGSAKSMDHPTPAQKRGG